MIPVKSKFIDCYIFRLNEGKIEFLLLLRNKTELYPNTWQSVQGKIKAGETAYDAALREFEEETGLTSINFWNLDYQNTFYYSKTNEMYIFPVFVVEVNHDKIVLSDEHIDYGWFSFEEALNKVIWRSQKEAIKLIYNDFFLNRDETKLEFTKL